MQMLNKLLAFYPRDNIERRYQVFIGYNSNAAHFLDDSFTDIDKLPIIRRYLSQLHGNGVCARRLQTQTIS